jgi:hypothetical protein
MYPEACRLCGKELRSLYSLAHAAEAAAFDTTPASFARLIANADNTHAALYCYLGLCPGDVHLPLPATEPPITVYDRDTDAPVAPAVAGAEHPCPTCGRPRLSLYELIRRFYADLPKVDFSTTAAARTEALRSIALRNARSLRCHVGRCGDASLPNITDVPCLLARPTSG